MCFSRIFACRLSVFLFSIIPHFFCPFSPTVILLSVQEIITKIGTFNPWTSISIFLFPETTTNPGKIARLSCDIGCAVLLWRTQCHFYQVVLFHLSLSTAVLCPFFFSFLNNPIPSDASARERAQCASKEQGTIKPSILKLSVQESLEPLKFARSAKLLQF